MRSGGSFEITKTGKTRQIGKPAKRHPDGHAPRDKDGTRLDRPAQEQPKPERPAPEGEKE